MNQEESNLQTNRKLLNFGAVKRLFSLGRGAWRGASFAVVLVTLVVWFAIIFSSPPASMQNWIVTMGFALVAAALSLLLGQLIVSVLNKFQKVPELYRWVLVGSVFLLFNLLMPGFRQLFNVLIIIIYVLIVSSLLGAGIGGLKSAGEKTGQRRVVLTALLLGSIGVVVAVFWAFWPGSPHEVAWSGFAESGVRPLAVENPAEEGPYSVRTLTYGSGVDQRRSEYGADVDIQTDSVDVSPMVKGGGGITGWLRQNYWGFDLSNVPLNARVWYPEGEGPFPLVLVVHGNHSMDAFSDPGYDYLGELLASRGYIVSSVDQNFLNGVGMLEAVLGGLVEENDARGYLLLQHLGLWHEWNESQNHYFSGKVATEKIALIGHSRGGEAAAIAAAFNDLPVHPDNAAISFDFGFDIGAVIAIAPSDGQYRPRRMGTPLEDINYLVMQGSVDSDVRSFAGSRQYDRVRFSPDYQGFKAAVYLHNANHGQFNTRWGKIDFSAGRWFLNLSQIMSAAEQETAAKVFISAFLEASLHGEQEYERLFENPLSGKNWLPKTVYLSQYQSSDTIALASFDEGLNLESATLPGAKLSGANLTIWREEPPALGTDQRRDTVSVRLGWDQDLKGIGSYSMELPAGFTLDERGMLTFALANISQNNSVDLTVTLTDKAGQEASLPLSHLVSLPPALPYRMYKFPLQVAFEAEPVFTTYAFELEDFWAENDKLNLSGLKTIDFIFDITPAGDIYLDDLGIRPGYATE
ncbi:alpha/beta hydrolase [Dethiobacter alkaliphilus]|uniref:Uncharacterized protein n=1 Tax=Dethiobacter alkaliphilus AHT 1 TaxID=555088 RepID=C0GKB7_DETAL|nr:alpha/beta hydrolase [Dethiobacter alkaliphilus]EEG76232.1 hypothetical protein DealDRAFT_2926 [Dethiobacter alkaliphilus AHT 1]